MKLNLIRYGALIVGYIIFIVGYYYLAASIGYRDTCPQPVDLTKSANYGGGIAGVVIGLLFIIFGHIIDPSKI